LQLGGLGKRQSFHKSDDGIASSGFESPLSKYKPKLNSKLKERLDALVQEATAGKLRTVYINMTRAHLTVDNFVV
jgi:hypothetical protein